jgi:hypothetical protein
LPAEVRKLIGDRRITVVFDRDGYSPKLFVKILDAGFDILTYRKGRWRKVARRHFQRQHAIIDGQRVDDVLADQEVRLLGGKLKLRQVTRLKGDHQTPVLTSRRDCELARLIAPHYRRADLEGCTLVQTALASAADIKVTDSELLVTLVPLSSAHRSRAIAALCAKLNTTATAFPGTNLRLRYVVAGQP